MTFEIDFFAFTAIFKQYTWILETFYLEALQKV
jgi:hypothetical protein